MIFRFNIVHNNGGKVMKKAKKLCRINATAILKFFSFRDGTFAFFYEIRKNGLVKYYVNCNKKNYGPYEKVRKSDNPEITVSKGDSFKTFAWEGVINDEEYIFIGGKNYGKKKIPTWEDTVALLDKMCEEASEATPDEEYDEKKHVLRNNKEHLDWFVTSSEKLGPYHQIQRTAYKDESHFQFVYYKSKDDKEFYYNLNGKEYGPFLGWEPIHCHLFYDCKGRAIVNNLPEKYILIDGEKTDFFEGKCINLSYSEEPFGYELIMGDNYTYKGSEIIYNGTHIHPEGGVKFLKDGSVAYVREPIYEKSAWFVKRGEEEIRVSAWFDGEQSRIVGNALFYLRGGVPYLMLEGREYNGFALTYDIHVFESETKGKTGYVFLKKGCVYFLEVEDIHQSNTPITCYTKGSEYYENQCKEIDNIMKLVSEKRFAGECSL